jgi:glycosyltransferase involved in cell wall biosynthesis
MSAAPTLPCKRLLYGEVSQRQRGHVPQRLAGVKSCRAASAQADVAFQQRREPLRAALIDPNGQYAGNHHYTDQLSRGLSHAGAKVTVYAHGGNVDHSPVRPYEYLEPFHGIYGRRPKAIRGVQFLRCLAATFAGIERRNTDVVHIQLWQHDIRELLQVGLARLLGKKVVITIHDITAFGKPNRARNLKWMMSHAGGIVVHNRYCFDLLTSFYEPKTPIAVIPHVNQAGSLGRLPDRASARNRLNLPQNKTVFLFFGNCRQEKGLDIALHAVAKLKEYGDKLLFVTAGKMKPHEEAFFRGLASELELGTLLRMDVGLIPDDAALDYYRAANAVVLPYRQIHESGVAITASTCGRAVLASDLPPLLEATENGRLGLHFRNEDANDLARVMKRALSMQNELDAFGDQAREKVLRERDPDVIGAQTYALYQQVLVGTDE